MSKLKTVFSLLLAVWLLGCSQVEPLPTQVPTAVPAQPIPPTATPLPPTLDFRQLTPTIQPTIQIPTLAIPTRSATNTPEPISPLITINNLTDNASLILGSEITVSGLAQRESSHTIWVTLISIDRQILADLPATISKGTGRTDSWELLLTVPESVLAPAQLQASIRNTENQIIAFDAIPVVLSLDTGQTDRYVVLNHPVANQTVAAGYYLYMNGITARPVGGRLHMLIFGEDCQTISSRSSFGISGRGSEWYGYAYIPKDVSGFVCAVAYFGTPGEENWRMVIVPINVLPDEDETAILQLVSPQTGTIARSGESFTVTGIAYNAPNSEIFASISLDGGQILAQGTAIVDSFGYWELTVPLPAGFVGKAAISVSAGIPGEDGFVQTQLLFTIEPGVNE